MVGCFTPFRLRAPVVDKGRAMRRGRSRMRNLQVAVLLCATLGAHGLHIQATHFAPRITDTALRPCSPQLSRRPPCLSRGQSLTMGAAPPAGFEWGERDRERWFDSMPSPLRRVGKPLLLLGALCGIASLPVARGRFWDSTTPTRPLLSRGHSSQRVPPRAWRTSSETRLRSGKRVARSAAAALRVRPLPAPFHMARSFITGR